MDTTKNKPSDDALALHKEAFAAEYLNISPRTLRDWRVRGGGPKYVRVSSRAVRYRKVDLDEWAASRLERSTSERSLHTA